MKNLLRNLGSRVILWLLYEHLHPRVGIHVLPGGVMPDLKTDGAVGYDVCLRAIVDPWKMDPLNDKLRMPLFDFGGIAHESIKRFIEWQEPEPGHKVQLSYRLDPGEKALCGIGFATSMPFSVCYLALCRSGMASRHEIMVSNAPGTIDPDYRGEAGIHLYNTGKHPFYLFKGMRVAQVMFTRAVFPSFLEMQRHSDLPATMRGPNGFGSTGLHERNLIVG